MLTERRPLPNALEEYRSLRELAILTPEQRIAQWNRAPQRSSVSSRFCRSRLQRPLSWTGVVQRSPSCVGRFLNEEVTNLLENGGLIAEHLFPSNQHHFHPRPELLHEVGECGVAAQTANQ